MKSTSRELGRLLRLAAKHNYDVAHSMTPATPHTTAGRHRREKQPIRLGH